MHKRSEVARKSEVQAVPPRRCPALPRALSATLVKDRTWLNTKENSRFYRNPFVSVPCLDRTACMPVCRRSLGLGTARECSWSRSGPPFCPVFRPPRPRLFYSVLFQFQFQFPSHGCMIGERDECLWRGKTFPRILIFAQSSTTPPGPVLISNFHL